MKTEVTRKYEKKKEWSVREVDSHVTHRNRTCLHTFSAHHVHVAQTNSPRSNDRYRSSRAALPESDG